MFACACISRRAQRLAAPPDLPELGDRDTLTNVLTSFGTTLLREVSDPTVIGAFRLAIAEVVHAPEVARVLDAEGRATARAALRTIMTRARASGLLTGDPERLAESFAGLLWGQLMVGLLLGIAERPSPRASAARARDAAVAFLQLHPPPA